MHRVPWQVVIDDDIARLEIQADCARIGRKEDWTHRRICHEIVNCSTVELILPSLEDAYLLLESVRGEHFVNVIECHCPHGKNDQSRRILLILELLCELEHSIDFRGCFDTAAHRSETSELMPQTKVARLRRGCLERCRRCP